ncbi:MAG: DUF3016 domain-containing protein [Pseudomonadota bacterium]
MNTFFRQAALAAVVLLAAGSASAGAKLTFVQPETFSDVPFSSWDRERLLKDLRAHFDKLAATLPPGQQLDVEVTDIDLAGETWPANFGGQNIRIMRGRADWPKMSLRYTITQNGQVLKSGTADIADMNYQQNMTRFGDSDALRYEKRMLDQWFKQVVAAR